MNNSNCRKLYLLLWKNFTLHRRHKFRLMVEIFIPLLLFLLLMVLRKQGVKHNMPECHFDEKALPSAGFWPFFQNTVCTFNNTCHQNERNQPLNQSAQTTLNFLNNILDDLEELSNKYITKSKVEDVETMFKDVEAFSKFLRKLTNPDGPVVQGTLNISELFNDTKDIVNSVNNLNINNFTPNTTQILLQSKLRFAGVQGLFDIQRVSLRSHLCNRDALSDLIIVENRYKARYLKYQLCSLSENDASIFFRHLLKKIDWKIFYYQFSNVTKMNVGMSPPRLETIIDTVETFNTIMKELKELPSLYYIRKNVNNLKSTSDFGETMVFTMQLFQTFFCGRNSTVLFDPDNQGLERKFEELKEQMKESTKNNKDKTKIYEYDNSTNTKCNELFEYLETNDKTQILWQMFKPFIRGKILYTPVTKATTKIIEKMNETVVPLVNAIENLSKLTEQLSLMSLMENSDEETSVSSMNFMNNILNSLNEDKSYFGYSSQDLYDFFIAPNFETLVEFLMYMSDFSDNLRTYLQCIDTNRFEGISDEKRMLFRSIELQAEKKFFAGIVFDDLHENDKEELPTFIKYKIRMDAKQVESSKRIFDFFPKAGSRRRPTYDLKYLTFGFAFLQDAIDHAIIKLQTGSEVETGVYTQQFPYPCYIMDQFLFLISLNFAFFMTVAWLYTCSMITKGIVTEKQLRLKEVMKIMGLENGILWVAWFIESILIMIISCIFLSVIFTYGGILERSDPVVIYIYLLSHCFAIVMISFLLSTFFSNANIAAVGGGTIFFLFYLPTSFLNRFYMDMNYWLKFLSCIMPSCAFSMGAIYLSFLEENGEGAQWGNLGVSPIPDDTFSLGHCIGMNIFDGVLFMLIALYIESVFPGQYGIAKPWYYFLTKSYWFGTNSLTDNEINQKSNGGFQFNDDFEDEPSDLTLGVSIQNLVKIYGNRKRAVDDLSLNFYESQITSFLGHNGAGKTSTISMLIGLYAPTSGNAYINGYSVTKNMDDVRRSLGVCPQYNVLFEGLTVEEHLWFYGCLKGGTNESVAEETEELLVDLGLEGKRKEFTGNLSGGMKRKLSVGIAFTAGSKTVILDEPTAGVDPCARRSIWELLIKYKRDRTIILTTHHMDEAELLGDRIAVIANGKLRCCGSSLFLKARYGKGYYLTMVKSPEKHLEMNGNCNDFVDEKTVLFPKFGHLEEVAAKMSDFVKKYVREGELIENVGADMTFLIPKKYQEDGSLLKLLESLEKQQNYLPISSYGISDSSFEEIFLRISETARDNVAVKNTSENRSLSDKLLYNCGNFIAVLLSCLGQKKKKRPDVTDYLDGYTSPPPSPSKQVMGKWLFWQQFVALIVRRVHHTKRDYKGLFCELAMPLFFICLSMGLSEFTASYSEEPAIELHPWHFKPPNYIFFENQNSTSQSSNSQIESLLSEPGLGNRCVKDNRIKKFECLNSNKLHREDLIQRYNISEANKIVDCSCSLGSIRCPAAAGGPTPPSVVTATGDILQNVTGRNVSDWIVKTTKKYYKRRFGGFSFGLKNPVSEFLDNVLANLSHRLVNPLSSRNYNVTVINDVINHWRRSSRNTQPVDNVRVWFNNRGWISSVTFVNLMNNVLLRSKLDPGKDPADYGISITNHPMKYGPDQAMDIINDHGDLGFITSLCIIFALSFVPVSFIIFIIEDKSSGSKHLQYVSGLKPILYWLSSFIFDIFKALFVVFLCVLIFLAFDEQSYISDYHISGFTFLLFLFCFACIPLMYIATNFFDSASAAFITLSSVNLFVGCLTTISIYILRMLDNKVLEDLASVLDKVYLIFPHYCLGRGLMDLYSTNLMASVFADYGVDLHKNPYHFNFMGLNLLLLGLQGVIFFVIVVVIDYGVIHVKRYEFPTTSNHSLKTEDEKELFCDQDVLQEQERARSAKPDDYVLLIQDLCKVYDPLKPPAVNKLCLTVGNGQCFGLLGVNGAGKTTTFKMLTGDTTVTSGDAFIGGYSIKSELEETCKVIGYCPQFDALDPLLTALEHLEFYARISGIPERSIKTTAYWAIKKLGLSQYAHIPAGTYSGGNKRKLSTAIALVGYPAVIFLDEPTTGMDPHSKRFLWNCILDVVKDGHCVVLTSHSMEECEALCTKLAIMVSGQFRCLGSIQQLKNKYGAGYTATLKASEDVAKVKQMMVETFGNCAILREEHLKQLQYGVNSSLQLSFIFRQLEEFRRNSLIETYSVTQTTLEQVFVNFAKEPTPASPSDASPSLQVEIVPSTKNSHIGDGDDDDEGNPELINLIIGNGKAIYEVDRETVV